MELKKYMAIGGLLLIQACGGEENNFGPIVTPPDETFFADREVEIVFENDPGGINVVFLGDGYIKEDLGTKHGAYKKEAHMHIEYMFSQPPFEQYKQYFNAYIVYAESDHRGIDGPNGVERNTALDIGHADFKFGTAEFSVPAYQNYDLLLSYAREAVPSIDEDDIILVSANLAGGGTGGGGVAVFGNMSTTIMLHEVGHAFGRLADEYYFEEYDVRFDTRFAPNLDSTNNLDIIKWSHFVNLDNYSNVTAFEGGGYTPNAVWRPESESIMGNAEFFNAPSREAIVKRIFEVKGMEYSFDQFLANDVIPSAIGRTHSSGHDTNRPPLVGCMVPYQ